MRIGILADIHDAVPMLRRALTQFVRQRVDLVVTLGDAFETMAPGSDSVQVAGLLVQAGARGVWGNHDVGLSTPVSGRVRQQADPGLLDYAASLRPQLVIGGCRFSHNEPWLDAQDLEELWYWENTPGTIARASRSFEAVPEKYLFMGHYHTWILIATGGRVEWDGSRPLELGEHDRYLIVVAAVCDGCCLIFDTDSRMLMPVTCAA